MITTLLTLILIGTAAQLTQAALLRRVLELAQKTDGPVSVALLQVARVCSLPRVTQQAVTNSFACVVDAVQTTQTEGGLR